VSRRSKYTTYPIGPLSYSRMVEALREVMSPVLKGEVIDSSVQANTNIFDTDLEAPGNGYWVIQCITDTAGYPKVVLTTAKGSVIGGLNESSNLAVDSWYEFWFAANKGDKINVQFSVSATVTVRVFFIGSP